MTIQLRDIMKMTESSVIQLYIKKIRFQIISINKQYFIHGNV
jgi:hypothetical protein